MATVLTTDTNEWLDLNLFNKDGREVAAEYLDRRGYSYNNCVYQMTRKEFEWWSEIFATLNKLFQAYTNYEYCHGKRSLKRKIARVSPVTSDLREWAQIMLDAFADYI